MSHAYKIWETDRRRKGRGECIVLWVSGTILRVGAAKFSCCVSDSRRPTRSSQRRIRDATNDPSQSMGATPGDLLLGVGPPGRQPRIFSFRGLCGRPGNARKRAVVARGPKSSVALVADPKGGEESLKSVFFLGDHPNRVTMITACGHCSGALRGRSHNQARKIWNHDVFGA